MATPSSNSDRYGGKLTRPPSTIMRNVSQSIDESLPLGAPTPRSKHTSRRRPITDQFVSESELSDKEEKNGMKTRPGMFLQVGGEEEDSEDLLSSSAVNISGSPGWEESSVLQANANGGGTGTGSQGRSGERPSSRSARMSQAESLRESTSNGSLQQLTLRQQQEVNSTGAAFLFCLGNFSDLRIFGLFSGTSTTQRKNRSTPI